MLIALTRREVYGHLYGLPLGDLTLCAFAPGHVDLDVGPRRAGVVV